MMEDGVGTAAPPAARPAAAAVLEEVDIIKLVFTPAGLTARIEHLEVIGVPAPAAEALTVAVGPELLNIVGLRVPDQVVVALPPAEVLHLPALVDAVVHLAALADRISKVGGKETTGEEINVEIDEMIGETVAVVDLAVLVGETGEEIVVLAGETKIEVTDSLGLTGEVMAVVEDLVGGLTVASVATADPRGGETAIRALHPEAVGTVGDIRLDQVSPAASTRTEMTGKIAETAEMKGPAAAAEVEIAEKEDLEVIRVEVVMILDLTVLVMNTAVEVNPPRRSDLQSVNLKS